MHTVDVALFLEEGMNESSRELTVFETNIHINNPACDG